MTNALMKDQAAEVPPHRRFAANRKKAAERGRGDSARLMTYRARMEGAAYRRILDQDSEQEGA